MTDHVKGFHRRQQILLPDTVDDYVTEDNPVRFMEVFVDNRLNLAALGFTHTEIQETGRPSYDPVDMLKLYLYGYLNQVRSSRKLEKECHRNLELIWLMRKLAPDHKTISDFRKNNVDRIKPVFQELHRLLVEMGPIGGDLVGIDGTKLKAVNSDERSVSPRDLERRLKQLDEKIDRYLKELDENDRKEDGEPQLPQHVKGLPEKIERLKTKKALFESLQARMAQTGEKEICLTDPESRTMPNNGKLEVCYNAQIAVEGKNRLVVEYDVSNHAADHRELGPMALAAKEALGVGTLTVTADKGYYSAEQVGECLRAGITTYIPRPDKGAGAAKRLNIAPGFHRKDFHYDPITDTVLCPAGASMTARDRSWVEGRGEAKGVWMVRYKTTACRGCPLRKKCSSSPGGRAIHRREDEGVVDVMNARMRTWEGRRMMELRQTLVEHPFGTIKRGLNQGYLLLKGQRKVKGEFGLTCIAYNMRRAINIVGTTGLVAHLNPT